MTPVTIVTGFLGSGKTTAIRRLLAHAPPGARWAVLVNEAGEVGIDGAILGESGLTVREVAGGCICCANALPFQVALVRLLREVRPDRVIIEPSGLADPSALVDALGRPGLAEHVDLRATIAIVHPLRALDPRLAGHPVHRAQLDVADVIAVGFADVSRPADLAACVAAMEALDPPKLAVAPIAHGALDPAWLELDPSPRALTRTVQLGAFRLDLSPRNGQHGFDARTWTWPREARFDRDRLEAALQALVRPGPALPAGAIRFKGIFRTPGRWLRVDADDERITWHPVAWRRDSRALVVAEAASGPRWEAVEAALQAARLADATGRGAAAGHAPSDG